MKGEYENIRDKILLDIISVLIVLVSPATFIYIIAMGKRSYDLMGIDNLFLATGGLFFFIAPIVYGLWYYGGD